VYIETLAVTAFLFSIVFLIACTPSKIHNHVLDPETPENLETTAPTWVEEFANSVATVDGPQPHVLLISLDTLRADHLGAWGYDRPTSPFLDELARFGVRFDRAFSHSPKTAPSHMSVFTGTFPSNHGAHFEYQTKPPVAFPAPRDLKTLPEVMREAGYRTAAWTGGGQVSRKSGFARGFDRFVENLGNLTPKKTADIRTWFKSNSDRQCFLFLHTYQIHDPYLPPPPYNSIFTDDQYRGWIIGDKKDLKSSIDKSNFDSLHAAFWRKTGFKPDPALVGDADRQRLLDLYDGGIRYTDDVLQGFFEDLRHDGLLENTLVILFSDHGEEFLEHGGLLHEKLYQETLHVPLIFFWPARIPRGLEVEAQVPLMDLTPTLLDLVGLETPAQSNAHSLASLFTDNDPVGPRPVYSEEPWVHRTPHRAYRSEGQMVYDHGDEFIELFDISEDPLENIDLSTKDPKQVLSLLSEMVAFLAGQTQPHRTPEQSASELTEDEIEALRALGYVE